MDFESDTDDGRLSIRSSDCCLSVHMKPWKTVSNWKKMGVNWANDDRSWHTIR